MEKLLFVSNFFLCQKGAQISFSFLPFHRPEKESGRSERGGICQTPDGETNVFYRTYIQILKISDVGSNVVNCRLSTCCNSSMLLFSGSVTGFPLRTGTLAVALPLIQISFPVYRTNPIKRPSPSLRRQEN